MTTLFSSFLDCLKPSSSEVSDSVGGSDVKKPCSKESKTKSNKPGAPLVVPHFPSSSYISRL